MCNRNYRHLIGLGCIALGAGILLTYIVSRPLLVFVEAIALSAVGVALIKR